MGIEVRPSEARSILTPQHKGVLSGYYSYTLNPYRGCAFGCRYCYAKEFTHDDRLERSWGSWVEPKLNAPRLLYEAALKLADARVFMSSATDPYQPLERKYRLTRACLEVMLAMIPGPRFVHIHTRSPFVLDDLGLLLAFEDRIEVNVSITTNDDYVRKLFEPTAPSIERRLETVRKLREAGVPVRVAVSPVLPSDPADLARRVEQVSERAFVDSIRFPKPEGYGLEQFCEQDLQRYLGDSHPRAVVRCLVDRLGDANVARHDRLQ